MKKTKNKTQFTYIWCQQANQERRNYSRDSSDSVDNRHDSSRVVTAKVQSIHFHPRIECSHQTHGSGEEDNHGLRVTAGVRGQDHAYSRTDRRYRRCKYLKIKVEITYVLGYITDRINVLIVSKVRQEKISLPDLYVNEL